MYNYELDANYVLISVKIDIFTLFATIAQVA